MITNEVAAWSGLRLIEPVQEGNKNVVWRGELSDSPVAVRQSTRDPWSLAWELDLIEFLDLRGFVVPTVHPSDSGQRSIDGVVVQAWLAGRAPTSASDWRAVGDELKRLHRETSSYVQRPGCCVVTELATVRRSGDADLDAMPGGVVDEVTSVFRSHLQTPTAVVHGDVDASNIRVSDGCVGFLDWDESRVDLTWHDLSVLPEGHLPPEDRKRAIELSHAWEATNGWVVEPEYARRRLAELQQMS